jgi:hypothetical protein
LWEDKKFNFNLINKIKVNFLKPLKTFQHKCENYVNFSSLGSGAELPYPEPTKTARSESAILT